jgi:hypothetical protein
MTSWSVPDDVMFDTWWRIFLYMMTSLPVPDEAKLTWWFLLDFVMITHADVMVPDDVMTCTWWRHALYLMTSLSVLDDVMIYIWWYHDQYLITSWGRCAGDQISGHDLYLMTWWSAPMTSWHAPYDVMTCTWWRHDLYLIMSWPWTRWYHDLYLITSRWPVVPEVGVLATRSLAINWFNSALSEQNIDPAGTRHLWHLRTRIWIKYSVAGLSSNFSLINMPLNVYVKLSFSENKKYIVGRET